MTREEEEQEKEQDGWWGHTLGSALVGISSLYPTKTSCCIHRLLARRARCVRNNSLMSSLLLSTLVSPLVGAIALLLTVPGWDTQRLRKLAFFSCCVSLWLTLALWVCFDFSMLRPQFVFSSYDAKGSVFQWVGACFAADGLSLLFMVLTAFTLPICLLLAWSHLVKEYCLLFLILEFLLFGVFCSFDVFVFYGRYAATKI